MKKLRKVEDYDCPVEAAIDAIGGRWKILIMWHLRQGTRRYGELKRLIPDISEKMLIQQLKELERDGIISRLAYPEVPPRVEYTVTAHGNALVPSLIALADWGREHLHKRTGQAP